MSKQKQLGTQHETDIVNWLKSKGWKYATRIVLKGGKDEGDVVLSERIPFVIEAKTAKSTTDRAALGTWLRELATEVENGGYEGGAVVHKKRGTTDVGEYIVLMPMKYLHELLCAKYADLREPPADVPRLRLVRRRRDG